MERVMKGLIRSSGEGCGDALYVADLGVVAERFAQFRAALPRVRPFYAVKCNPDRRVLGTLARLGAGFDCASQHEIELAEGAVARGALRERVVYANPHKDADSLAYAAGCGVRLMTFDCADELRKVHRVAPHAHLLLRVAVEDSLSNIPLSSKFGAHPAEIPPLLRLAAELDVRVVGVAFHTGSGCTSHLPYIAGLKLARQVFNDAREIGLPPMTVLDIGGGFPGYDGEVAITFAQIADAIRPTIDKLFESSVDVIAEPGRFFVASAYALGTRIVAARRNGLRFDYYIGDGVYGSFKDACMLGTAFPVKPLLTSAAAGSEEEDIICNLYGPTQDPFDVVSRGVMLPKLSAGDWLFFPNMGAYTMSLASNFAGFTLSAVHYYHDCEAESNSV